MSGPKISLRINNDLTAHELINLAVSAEASGIDQLWISNDLMLRSAPAILGAITQRTKNIYLGIGIANPYTIHPAELAMLAATLQELCEGRFLLGLGAGSGEFLSWLGIDQKKPLTATREALRAIRSLLKGQRPAHVEGAGVGWADDASLRFSPPSVPVPIYLGAMSPKMLALAGAEADGVLALHLPPEHFFTTRELILSGARSAGRTLTNFDTPACVWLSLSEDQHLAERALAKKLAYYGTAFSPFLLAKTGLAPEDFAPAEQAFSAGNEDAAVSAITPQMLSLGIAGNPNTVVARCLELLAAGVTHLSFGPPLGQDPVSAVNILSREVLTELRPEF